MIEIWKPIENFLDYSVSSFGNIRADRTDRILALNQNQYGLVYVGMVRDGKQFHRSVPLLVANAFIPRKLEAFDTPINKDGDRWNNHVENLVWRPRWFAVKYNQQFRYPYIFHIPFEVQDIHSGEVCKNSMDCAKRYGLLESDVVLSIANQTVVWPTYQRFRVISD